MHHNMILVVAAKSKEEATDKAQEFIDTATSEYRHGVDWGVIGGRWSGDLLLYRDPEAAEKWSAAVKAAADKHCKFPQLGFTESEIKAANQDLLPVWDSLFPGHTMPFNRDRFMTNGSADDVLPLDEKMLEGIENWLREGINDEDLRFATVGVEKEDIKADAGLWCAMIDFHS